jgi:hypothetical protein
MQRRSDVNCKATISRDDDEPELHCELDTDHPSLHQRGNVRWYDPVVGYIPLRETAS